MSTKLTMTLLYQLHIRVESVKDNDATSVHLFWIAKQLTCARKKMSHFALIINKSRFYVPIVPHDFCALALACLLYQTLANCSCFIVLLFFILFLSNFDVTRYFSNHLLLLV